MYVYICSDKEAPLYTVGFYRPDGVWEPESDHRTCDEAAKRVAYLNGSPRENRAVHLDDPWAGSGL